MPEFGRIRKEFCLDVLKGLFLILAFSWLFYDSFYAIPFLLPILVPWRRECRASRRQREEEDAYVRLARKTIEEYVAAGRKIEVPEGLPAEMYHSRAGTFVSVKKEGRLRGCIGTIQAVHGSVAEEIIENAVSAAARDPRFPPIEPGELGRLAISVDVLGSIEKIDSKEELDVKRYGVIVTRGFRKGLLLPNLEGVDTVDEQIAIAKQKAGIGEEEETELERFEVVRH